MVGRACTHHTVSVDLLVFVVVITDAFIREAFEVNEPCSKVAQGGDGILVCVFAA